MSVYAKSGGPPVFVEAQYSDASSRIAFTWLGVLWRRRNVRAIRTFRCLRDAPDLEYPSPWIIEVWCSGRRANRRRPTSHKTLLWGECDELYLTDSVGVRGGHGRRRKTIERSDVYLWEPNK
jgi:hypothetical protein